MSMISIKNLSKYFNKGKDNEIHVINNVSLELPEKGMVAFYGKSGCGKTTLLNVIGGLAQDFVGKIVIDGHDVLKNTDFVRNKYIGYVFQSYNLNKYETVYDNVANVLKVSGYNDKNVIYESVYLALKSVGMEKYILRFPDTLSGGQQQRVAIARALVKNPKIILADEPTGNLDEENTGLVMKLLKRISKSHLVILVTHESKIVESFCDMVVELSDGSIMKIRQDFDKTAFCNRKRNTIILEELEKKETIVDFGLVSFYGDLPNEQLQISIINYQGKIYLKSNTVQLIGEDSEVVIKEKNDIEKIEGSIDDYKQEMIEIPCVIDNMRKTGKLFNWRSSFVSGLKNINNSQKGNKVLKVFLTCFSIVLVLLTSFYGTSIEKAITARNAHNSKSFYVYVPDYEKAKLLIESRDNLENGIDYLEFKKDSMIGDQKFYIDLPMFESSLALSWDEVSLMSFHGTVISEKIIDKSHSKDGELKNGEAIITTAVADTIIKNSKFSFINSYDSIIGLAAKTANGSYKFVISEIIESNEYAIYLNENYFAEKYYEDFFHCHISTGEEYNVLVQKGEVAIRINSISEETIPNIGDNVVINGNTFTISQIALIQYSYEDWLSDKNINKSDQESLAKSDFEYIEEYYSEYKNYVAYCEENRDKVDYDAYKKLISDGCEEAYYVSVMELCGQMDYYYASQYKEEYGYYPNQSELEECKYLYNDPYIIFNELLSEKGYQYTSAYTYVLNDEDYIDLSKEYGETIGFAMDNVSETGAYAVVHSTDYEATKSFLAENFTGIEVPNSTLDSYITPEMLYDMEIATYKNEIIKSCVVWLIFVTLICICVYMLMRANVMNKIKEIGIYRCIGVSIKNIIFKFFVECIVMIGTTAGVGHLIVSIILFIINNSKYSYVLNGSLFYPWWIALGLIVIILCFSSVFGLIPIISLLKKSPSDIMSKYDI